MLTGLQKSNLLKQLDWQEVAVKYAERQGTAEEFIVNELAPHLGFTPCFCAVLRHLKRAAAADFAVSVVNLEERHLEVKTCRKFKAIIADLLNIEYAGVKMEILCIDSGAVAAQIINKLRRLQHEA